MGQPLGFGAQLRPGGGLDLDLDERLERASDSGEIDVGMNSAYDPRIDQGVHTVVGGRLHNTDTVWASVLLGIRPRAIRTCRIRRSIASSGRGFFGAVALA